MALAFGYLYFEEWPKVQTNITVAKILTEGGYNIYH